MKKMNLFTKQRLSNLENKLMVDGGGGNGGGRDS